MGLFKKKTKQIINEENKISNDVEILDFTSEENQNETIEKKKERKTLFIILGVIIAFIVILPIFTKLFSKTSVSNYNSEMKEITENKTINGLIEIDKEEGNIIAKKIKFYNFRKTTNNEINVTYLPSTKIKDVDSLNIYIELYNSNKKIISRTKFTSDTDLERKVQGIYTLKLNEVIYQEASYGKIVLIKENEWGKTNETLTCTTTLIDDNFDVNYTITYNFSELGLQNYNVKRKASIKEREDVGIEELPEETINKYTNIFKRESEELSKFGITDIFLDESSLEYDIDFNKENTYKGTYIQGNTIREIKLNERKAGWSCK